MLFPFPQTQVRHTSLYKKRSIEVNTPLPLFLAP